MVLAEKLESLESDRIKALWPVEVDDFDKFIEKTASITIGKGHRRLSNQGNWVESLSAPLFFERSFVELCTGCQVTQEIDLLRFMMENNLLTPILYAPYATYSDDILAAVHGRPHVSRQALIQIERQKAEASGDSCVCERCTEKRLKNIGRLKASERKNYVKYYVGRLAEMPKKASEPLISELNAALLKKSVPAIKSMKGKIETAVTLNHAATFGAAADVSLTHPTPEAADMGFFANSLGVAYSEEISKRKYLETILRHKGELSLVLQDTTNRQEELEIVKQINGEVQAIKSSARLRIYEIATTVFQADKRRLLEAIVGTAAFGPLGAGACLAADAAATMTTKTLLQKHPADAALAVYFGKSIPAVRVWRIQKDLTQTS